MKTRLLIGSINTPGPWFHATGEGVTVCELDEATGAISRVASHPHAENAMWMVKTADRLFVATERYLDGGEIGAFDAAFTRVGRAQKTPGGAICHLARSPDGKNLYAASYLGGVTVHAVDADGALSPEHQVVTYEGSGPNTARQEKPHPHQAVVSPDGGYLFVCDLGADRIWIHRIAGDRLGPAHALAVAPGSGPRHLVFHPRLPRFYLLGELDAVVRLFEGAGTAWKEIAAHSALPEGFAGTPGAGGIKFHPSEKTLTVSVRGSDNFAVFRVDARGDLSSAANFPTLGKGPRDFGFSPSGRWLLALNHESDAVVAFELDPVDGLPTGRTGAPFAIGCPMCVVF